MRVIVFRGCFVALLLTGNSIIGRLKIALSCHRHILVGRNLFRQDFVEYHSPEEYQRLRRNKFRPTGNVLATEKWQLLTKKKDRFAAHSQRFLVNLKGSANAQEPWLGIISLWTFWPSAKSAYNGVKAILFVVEINPWLHSQSVTF